MTIYVVSSGTTSGLTVGGGSVMSVFGSGTAAGIAVTAGGVMSAYGGGVTSNAAVAGGTEDVLVGGSSYQTSCGVGGVELVSGGVSYGTAIAGGALESVAGGAANGTRVAAGGYLNLSGSTASGTVVSAGGSFTLYGGAAADTEILGVPAANVAGAQTVLGDATVSGTTIVDGTQYVSQGTAVDTVISSTHLGYGIQEVEANGIARGTTLVGGTQYVSEGLAMATVVSAGEQVVYSGGVASEATILSGGQQIVSAGTAYGAVVDGGYETVREGGATSGSQLMSGGEEFVSEDGVSSDTVIMNGGLEVLSSYRRHWYGAGSASDTAVMAGGKEIVSAGGVSTHTEIDGGVVEVESTGQLAGVVTFSGSGGELVIDRAKMPTAEITGFKGGDSIELAMVAYESGDSVSVNAANVVTVSAGGATYNLKIEGAKVGETDFVFGPGSNLSKTEAAPAAAPRMLAAASATTKYVVSSGTTSGLTVGSMSVMSVFDTGVAKDIKVTAGGVVRDYHGGQTRNLHLTTDVEVGDKRPVEHVGEGGTAYQTSLHDATLVVSGGRVVGTKADGHARVVVEAGAISATSFTGRADDLVISQGGDAVDTVVGRRDRASIYGSARGLTVSGKAIVWSGAVTKGVVVDGGNASVTFNDSKSVDTKVINGGREYIEGKAVGTFIGDYGYGVVDGGGAAMDTTISGGQLDVYGGSAADTTITGGGALDLGYGAVTKGPIDFTGSGGITIETDTMPTDVISGFTAGDYIRLQNANIDENGSVSVETAGIVTISAGHKTYNLHIAGATVGETDFVYKIGVLTKAAPAQMAMLRPAASAAASAAAMPAYNLTAAEFAPRLAGGFASVMSSLQGGAPRLDHVAPGPLVAPISVTQGF